MDHFFVLYNWVVLIVKVINYRFLHHIYKIKSDIDCKLFCNNKYLFFLFLFKLYNKNSYYLVVLNFLLFYCWKGIEKLKKYSPSKNLKSVEPLNPFNKKSKINIKLFFLFYPKLLSIKLILFKN